MPDPARAAAVKVSATSTVPTRPKLAAGRPSSGPASELEDVECLLDQGVQSGSEGSKRSSEAADELRALLQEERAQRKAADARVEQLESELKVIRSQIIEERVVTRDATIQLEEEEAKVITLTLENERLGERIKELVCPNARCFAMCLSSETDRFVLSSAYFDAGGGRQL